MNPWLVPQSPFIDYARDRIEFLPKLIEIGKRDEALTLCMVYLDSFAQVMCHPSRWNSRNFVTTLTEHSGNELLGLIHPVQFAEVLEKEDSRLSRAKQEARKTLAQVLYKAYAGPPFELYKVETFKTDFEKRTGASLSGWRDELWRGTLAYIVYQLFRNPTIHHFQDDNAVGFEHTTWKGEPVPRIDFKVLYAALLSILAAAFAISEEASGQQFTGWEPAE